MSEIIYTTHAKRRKQAAHIIEIVEPVWAPGPFCIVQDATNTPRDARWAWSDGILEWDNVHYAWAALKGTEDVPLEGFRAWCLDYLADEMLRYGGGQGA